MAFNHESLNVYQSMLPFNVKVAIWTGAWDSKHALKEELSQILRMLVGLRKSWAGMAHVVREALVKSAQRQRKGSTKLATKKKSPLKPGSAFPFIRAQHTGFVALKSEQNHTDS